MTYTLASTNSQGIVVDSSGVTCQANNTDYSELAVIALDQILTQSQAGNGYMNALMSAIAGESNLAGVTRLPAALIGDMTPIEAALSMMMNGVLSQVSYGLERVVSPSLRTQQRTPLQKSFRQLPLGQAVVSLVILCATAVYAYGARHKVDKEWQDGNLTLRLLSIDPMQATGGLLSNATNSQLKVLDNFKLGATSNHLCLLQHGDAIIDGQVYGS